MFDMLENEHQTRIPREVISVEGEYNQAADPDAPIWQPGREQAFPNRDQVVAAYNTKDGHPLVVAFHRGCFDARADAIYFHSTGRAPSRDAIDRLNLTAVYNLDCSRYEEPEDDYAGGLRDVATQHGHGDDVQRSDGHDIAMADPAILDPRLLPQVSDQHDQSMNMAYKHQVLSQQPWLAKFVHDEDAAWDKVDWLRVATIDWTPSAAPHALASFANRAYIFKLWLKELQERSPLIEPLLLHHEAQGEIHHL